MKNRTKLFGIALAAVLAVVALGAGVAFAQLPTPNPDSNSGWTMGGRGGMMSGYAQNDSREWMDAMHQWMTTNGGMHIFVWNALADTLGLTVDELDAEVNSGKTIAQIAEEKGISRADLVATLEAAHEDSLAQAVADGILTQDQTNSISNQMDGRYEWMLDNMDAGHGMMGGRGGMMGYGQQSGGCQGNWNSNPANQQPRP